ncbi:MAG: DUF938 domain-containing protein [Alphaproteobacteria bacterium]
MATGKSGFEAAATARRQAPATERNRGPILSILRDVMPAPGIILEVASGTGQHGAWFAAAFPEHRWAPSDRDPGAHAGIDAWGHDAPAGNILPSRRLNAADGDWPVKDIADDLVAIFSANMIHIAPWEAGLGLLAGASRLLPAHGILFLYGPFLRGGRPVSENDRQFDLSLRARDPSWGLRDLDRVIEDARSNGLELSRKEDMPAGNLSLIFRPAP